MKKFAFFLFLVLLAVACQPNLGQKIEINYGETIEIPSEGLRIGFTEINDSRCPKDVQCPTAGEAGVTLSIEKDGNRETVELTGQGGCFDETGACGSEADAMGYRFQLLYVYPYPEEGVTHSDQDYHITLIVTIFQTN